VAIDSLPGGLSLDRTAATGRGASGQPTPQKIAELSQEFESMLVLQMIKQMRQSMLPDDEEQGSSGFGAETMTETIDLELARHLSRQGGIGLANVLQDAIARQTGAPASAPVSPAGTSPPPAAAQPDLLGAVTGKIVNPAVTLPLAAPISSPYGWRIDPLDGARRFHTGVDLPAAYGHAVPAAAEGQVVFAGEQGGYGLTVVVEHPGGLQSRYGHLSSFDVKAGDHVEAGQVIGRVGQTGRATGPHLHFELLREGRRLDPVSVTTAASLHLKAHQEDADLENGHESAGTAARGDIGDIHED
jgi:murein DD-endopeptidase MepM/ murein hydrolase activator NlpD